MDREHRITRRRFLRCTAAIGLLAGLERIVPAYTWSQPIAGRANSSSQGADFIDLVIRAEDTSIHWHGVIVPADMDGVPGVSFPGIKPGQTFSYRYPVRQNGTYWYHSLSATQEQSRIYGPLIIDPAEPEPFHYDRKYVFMLSDWTFEDRHHVLAKLKK